MLSKSTLILVAILLSGCAGVDVSKYREERPELRLEDYFNGTLDAWGMFQKRDGTVVKRFKVVIDARWEGDRGTLEEFKKWCEQGPKFAKVEKIEEEWGESTGEFEEFEVR